MIKKIVLAGGCFWTTEAVYRRIDGIVKVVSGYAGGTSNNPSFEAVAMGSTGHAECVLVEYEDKKINLNKILEVFWASHDPTTLDRQGPDIGTQYRSGIFYIDMLDLPVIKNSIMMQQKLVKEQIVTETMHIKDTEFYIADIHHQDYYSKNKDVVYSRAIIRPKIEKIEKMFGTRKSNIL
jgi:methionine-S-sulfoxide reductase